jgi:hypothetical protein
MKPERDQVKQISVAAWSVTEKTKIAPDQAQEGNSAECKTHKTD